MRTKFTIGMRENTKPRAKILKPMGTKEMTGERRERQRRRTLMAVLGGMSCPFPQTQVPDPHSYTIGAGGTSQEAGSRRKGTQDTTA